MSCRVFNYGNYGNLPMLFALCDTEVMPLADPKNVNVQITTGAGVDIEWTDGHKTHYSFQWLRDACPCATCEEERNKAGRKPGEPIRQPAALLPMYKPPVKPTTVTPVGKYAMNLKWNDGHESGIYSWDYLRAQCRCAECQLKSAPEGVQQ
jgi:DUF971 family protein